MASADDHRTYSIRQLCREFGATARALRFYEDKGMLSPARRGQTRVYDAKDRARLKLILRGRKFGFPLEEIRQWLLIYEEAGSEAQAREWITAADRQLTELYAQRDQLQEAIDELKTLRNDTADGLDIPLV